MRKVVHGLAGAALGAWLGVAFGWHAWGSALAGAIGGVLPDWDLLPARLGLLEHRSPLSHSLGASIGTGLAAALVALQWGAILPWTPGPVQLGLLIGGGSFLHVLLDAITRGGVALWAPLSFRRIRGPAASDDWGANLAAGVISLLLLWVALQPARLGLS